MGDGRRFRYPRSARLRRGPEIRALLREGSRRRCGALEVFHHDSPGPNARAGIIVPRYGHTIVRRNRLKRQLREFVRLYWLPASSDGSGGDIVIRARPGAYDSDAGALRESFDRCLELGGAP